MTDEEISDLVKGYTGAAMLQYGGAEERLKKLDAAFAKGLAGLTYNQVDTINRARKLAQAHLNKLHAVEERARKARLKAEEARNGGRG